MKNTFFSNLFAFFAVFMTTNCAPQSQIQNYDRLYQSYVNRMTVTPFSAITVNTTDPSPCTVATETGYNCLTVETETDLDLEKYSMAPLDLTTAISTYNYSVNIQTFTIGQWSGDFYSQNPMTILLTCGVGNGKEVDHTQGWGVITFQQGLTEYETYEGAECRFGPNSTYNTAYFTTKDTSKTAKQVNCECLSVFNRRSN